MTVLLLFCFPI